MPKYLLDTNICIFFFKEKYEVKEKLSQVGFENCFISEITLAELLYGAECSLDAEKNITQINKFINKVKIIPIFNSLVVYAKEKSLLRKMGNLIDDLDILIGATAIANNMILVTDNEKHLSRLSNVEFENWINR